MLEVELAFSTIDRYLLELEFHLFGKSIRFSSFRRYPLCWSLSNSLSSRDAFNSFGFRGRIPYATKGYRTDTQISKHCSSAGRVTGLA